jgi:hypothetical protein
VLTGQALAAPLPPSLAKAAVQAVFPAPGTSAPAVAVSLARGMESPLVTARFLVTACAVVLVVIAVGVFHWSQQLLDQDLPTGKVEAGDPRRAPRATPLAGPRHRLTTVRRTEAISSSASKRIFRRHSHPRTSMCSF